MAACPSCGADNPDGARFCSSCGTALVPEAATPARRERKFATALFADLVGSTSLGEREDPEVVQSLVGRTFDRLAQEIERYGGLLEKFMGDAVLAVFGVPSAHEDDPERAVRAAIEMQAVLSELNRGFATEGHPELAMRIGVEAGEVLVDVERATGPRDRMLTGDAVNTASRLQTAAEPGRVVVGPAVYASTKDVIDYREMEPLRLKGKAEPVAAWEALRIRARRRGERAPLGLEAPLVGRDEELAVLKQTFHRVDQEGRAALVTVLGTAGVGKSRLTFELLQYIEPLPQFVYWRKGRCLAYGNVPYSALAEAVKAQCEILEDDPLHLIAEKVDRAVEDLFGDRDVAEHVRALVGAPVDRQFSREELFDAWRRFLERLAARYPLVLILEDIHWADAGLLDFVEYLADWAQGSILLLTLARPELLELRPSWGGGKRNYSAIYLDPLTRAENERMIDDLLSTTLPVDIKRLIVERSDGNPLYTEEIVRMFIDRGVLRSTGAATYELAAQVEDVDVPRSIQGLIAARIDSLPAEEKALSQDAAVVGRTFWLGAVARLSELAEEQARTLLGRLRVKEIIVPREPPTFSGELELAFRHVLIRDVAYESLPKSARADKHVEVARWAEHRAGGRAADIAEILATHYAEALGYLSELGSGGDARREIEAALTRWARAAGDRAMRLFQPSEAVKWFRTGIEVADPDSDPRELANLWERYADACDGTESYRETHRAYLEALRRYDALGAESDAGRLESLVAFNQFRGGNYDEALSWSAHAVSRLDPLGDSADLAMALSFFGWIRWRRGLFEEAEQPLRRASELAKRFGEPHVEAQATHTLGVLLVQTGKWQEGMPQIEESYLLALESGDLWLRLRTTNNLASTLMDYAADYERIERILLDGLDLARKSGRRDMVAWLENNLCNLYLDTGRLERAHEAAAGMLATVEAISFQDLLPGAHSQLARVELFRGRPADADRLLSDTALAAMKEDPQGLPYVLVLKGRIEEALGRRDSALRVLLLGIEEIGSQVWVGKVEEVLFETVRMLTQEGRGDEAAQYLGMLRELGRDRPQGEAFAHWAEGLAVPDPDLRLRGLREAATGFGRIGRPIEEARSLLDLGHAESDAGQDPRGSFRRARDLLAECGAGLYLAQAETALERLGS